MKKIVSELGKFWFSISLFDCAFLNAKCNNFYYASDLKLLIKI